MAPAEASSNPAAVPAAWPASMEFVMTRIAVSAVWVADTPRPATRALTSPPPAVRWMSIG